MGEWISVKDRLPISNGQYIVCKDGWVFAANYEPHMRIWSGVFTDRIERVTHWMPLPEPPKGG